MNGVHPPDYNRFRELDFPTGKTRQNKNKRPRPEDFVPLSPTSSNQQNLPRYLVASAVSLTEGVQVPPLASHNVFQVEKGLDFISRDRLEVKEMKSGDLLIKVPDSKSADKFLKASYIDCIPVKISLHKTLNTVQGRFFSKKIIEISEEELLASLKDQKVVDVRKIMRRDNDKIFATGAAIITFDLIYRPETLKLGWERVQVEEYIPNPMRCVNCQRLGHTKKWCKNVEQCRECGYSDKHETCSRKYCVNCQLETHTSYDRECPTYWKHKSVNYIRISRRCTTREAWKIFNENPSHNLLQINPLKSKTTYAQITVSTVAANDKNTECKTKNTTHTNQNFSLNNTTNQKQPSLPKSKISTQNSLKQAKISSSSSDNFPQLSQDNNNKTNVTIINNQILNSKDKTANSLTNYHLSHTQPQNSPSQINSLNNESEIYSNKTADKVNSSELMEDETIIDNCSGCCPEESIPVGKETEDDINADLGLCTPPRKENLSDIDTRIANLYNKFPQLNVLITPNTLKSTQSLSQRGKFDE